MSKSKAMLSMKFLTLIFISYMTIYSFTFVFKIQQGDIIPNNLNQRGTFPNEVNQKDEVCEQNWFYYIFAFTIGAIWNVKKLLKVGAL